MYEGNLDNLWQPKELKVAIKDLTSKARVPESQESGGDPGVNAWVLEFIL